MNALESLDSLLDVVRKSGLVAEAPLASLVESGDLPEDPAHALAALVKAGLVTSFHARHLLEGKHKGFVLGAYKVLRHIGRGGSGIVYLAEHIDLHRQVALKVIRSDVAGRSGVLERFLREGRAAAALDHPNIVRVYDVGNADDVHFLVLEYAEGRTLEDLLRRKGRMPWRQAVGYAVQTARGLQHAHERGIVHRDVKPANLVLDNAGTIKILDMGLARFYDDPSDNLTERLGGDVTLGSADYIAPEQALNQLDARCDIYGLGATLYALLIGEPPFQGRSAPQKLLAHQLHSAVPPHRRDAGIPLELSAAVMRMLSKRPEDRFQTPAEVIATLEPWAREEAAAPVGDVVDPTVVVTPRRWRKYVTVVLAVLLWTVLAAWLGSLGVSAMWKAGGTSSHEVR